MAQSEHATQGAQLDDGRRDRAKKPGQRVSRVRARKTAG
ncbi:hypothetical protein RISK_001119 [Rhodopirellula islandica]|uniref:Uncharacterized protein n=1 Tax=Rhodopirellula islandica TaxID=595434 RepID=A0A0J1BJS2_RHOIS|nr:hypothetical protein RISK_001119 [Rhodopirellula islandica]